MEKNSKSCKKKKMNFFNFLKLKIFFTKIKNTKKKKENFERKKNEFFENEKKTKTKKSNK